MSSPRVLKVVIMRPADYFGGPHLALGAIWVRDPVWSSRMQRTRLLPSLVRSGITHRWSEL